MTAAPICRVHTLPGAVVLVATRGDRATLDTMTPMAARELASELLDAARGRPLCPTLAALLERVL